MPSTVEAVRAGALFASSLQSSDRPGVAQVRCAIAGALREFGRCGCAARVAGEFGDHPETAVARMQWALATVRRVYPVRVPAARARRTALVPAARVA